MSNFFYTSHASPEQVAQINEQVLQKPEVQKALADYSSRYGGFTSNKFNQGDASRLQKILRDAGLPSNMKVVMGDDGKPSIVDSGGVNWGNIVALGIGGVAGGFALSGTTAGAGTGAGLGSTLATTAIKTAIPAVASYIANRSSNQGSDSNSPSANYTDPKQALNYFGSSGEQRIGDLRNRINTQTDNLTNRFNSAADRASSDYNTLQGNYNSFMKSNPISYIPSNQDFSKEYSGYQNFADTGGFSGQDIQNLRARSNAPIRATYANAISDVDRRNVLAGGNLANASAAKAKMARELSYSLGDQSLNTEASLAEAIRSGKLAGLSGMTGIDTSRMSEGLANAGNNLQAQGMESNRQLGAMSGLTSLYGATPGQASMYGNQMLSSSSQGLQTEQLQNQLMQAIINGSLGRASQPSGLQTGLGNTASILNLLGTGASIYGNYRNSRQPNTSGSSSSYPSGQGGVYE